MSKESKNILSWVLTAFIMQSLVLCLSVQYNSIIIQILGTICILMSILEMLCGFLFIGAAVWVYTETLRDISDNLLIKIIMNLITVVFIILGCIFLVIIFAIYLEFIEFIGGLI